MVRTADFPTTGIIRRCTLLTLVENSHKKLVDRFIFRMIIRWTIEAEGLHSNWKLNFFVAYFLMMHDAQI